MTAGSKAPMAKWALVCGAGGFIGGHLVKRSGLHAEQSLDLAFLLADLLKSERLAKAKPFPAAAAL